MSGTPTAGQDFPRASAIWSGKDAFKLICIYLISLMLMPFSAEFVIPLSLYLFRRGISRGLRGPIAGSIILTGAALFASESVYRWSVAISAFAWLKPDADFARGSLNSIELAGYCLSYAALASIICFNNRVKYKEKQTAIEIFSLIVTSIALSAFLLLFKYNYLVQFVGIHSTPGKSGLTVFSENPTSASIAGYMFAGSAIVGMALAFLSKQLASIAGRLYHYGRAAVWAHRSR